MSTSESGISPSSPRITQLWTWPPTISTPSTLCPRYVFLCVLHFRVSHHLPAVIRHVSMILLTCFLCRVTNSLFHALPFQRRVLFRRILVLLFLKPPRLKKIRTVMMSKYQKMRQARRRRLLLHYQKILLLIKRGSVSKSLLPRVPPSRELQPVQPLFKKMT
jgi:hypothetical protein